MSDPSPTILDYSPNSRRSSRRGWIVIALAVGVFAARVGWMQAHKPIPTPAVKFIPVPMTFPPPQIPLDMQMGNSLNHNTEGQNVLYADGHVFGCPTTQPAFVVTPGTNSNVWLDNIYTVQTSNLANQEGVVSGLPYDDKDAIMLPTSK